MIVLIWENLHPVKRFLWFTRHMHRVLCAKSSGATYADAMHEYEREVSASLKKIGHGSFRLEIDETAPSHMISHHAIEDVILRELRNAR